MSTLSEHTFTALVDAGCTACGGKELRLKAYVDGLVPLMEGEPVGRVAWVYKGEMLVDGVYEIACAGCNAVLFADDRCPRCHAAHGLARGLDAPNSYPVPARCPRCEHIETRFIAFVPAEVRYTGTRAGKARTDIDLYDPGFRGYRVDCKRCGTVAERTDACPVCEAAAPIRPRCS